MARMVRQSDKGNLKNTSLRPFARVLQEKRIRSHCVAHAVVDEHRRMKISVRKLDVVVRAIVALLSNALVVAKEIRKTPSGSSISALELHFEAWHTPPREAHVVVLLVTNHCSRDTPPRNK